MEFCTNVKTNTAAGGLKRRTSNPEMAYTGCFNKNRSFKMQKDDKRSKQMNFFKLDAHSVIHFVGSYTLAMTLDRWLVGLWPFGIALLLGVINELLVGKIGSRFFIFR